MIVIESSASSVVFPSVTPKPQIRGLNVPCTHCISHPCSFIHAICSRPCRMGCCSTSLHLLNFYLSSLFIPVSQKIIISSVPQTCTSVLKPHIRLLITIIFICFAPVFLQDGKRPRDVRHSLKGLTARID